MERIKGLDGLDLEIEGGMIYLCHGASRIPVDRDELPEFKRALNRADLIAMEQDQRARRASQ